MGKSFWQKISLCFNPNLYKEITFQPLKKSFKFLALFLLFLTLFLSLRYSFDFLKFLDKTAENLPIFLEQLKDFPEIKIEKGEVTLPKEKFVQKFRDFSFIIDSAGEISSYLGQNEESALILIKNKAIYKTAGKTEIYDLSKINYFHLKFDHQRAPTLEFNGQTFELTAEKTIKPLKNKIALIFPFLFIFTFTFLFTIKSIQILSFSIFSILINKIKKLNLNYSNLLNVGIFALIPPLTFETLIKLTGLKIPYFGLIYSIIYLTFLILGLLKSKK